MAAYAIMAYDEHEIHFLGRTFLCLLACIVLVDASDRCEYASSTLDSEIVWIYEGENVTLACPAYKVGEISYAVDFKWFKQDFNCKSMTKIIARYMNHEGNSALKIKDPETMAINKITGDLSIIDVGVTDEQTFTCIFTHLEEHIATVHLKIKDFQAPVITGLSDALAENEDRNVKCDVPSMHPTEGFIQVEVNDKVVSFENLDDRETPPLLAVTITGEVEANGNIVTCTAMQNVSGTVKELATSHQVTIFYPYHTRVLSSADQPVEFADVTLICDITREGNPKEISEYIWQKDGHEIQGNQNVTLRGLTGDNAGSYQCLIKNRLNISTPLDDALELQLDVQLNTINLPGLITGCGALGAVAVIACSIAAMFRRTKRRKNQIKFGPEQYEDLGAYTTMRDLDHRRNTHTHVSGIYNEYDESGELSALPVSPTPPPLPDITDRRPLDLCPEADQHYSNRTVVMATTPRKPPSSASRAAKADSLEDILEYCQDNYSVCSKASAEKQPTTILGDCVDMKGVTVVEIEHISSPSNTSEYVDEESAHVMSEGTSGDYVDMKEPSANGEEQIDSNIYSDTLGCDDKEGAAPQMDGTSGDYVDMKGAEAGGLQHPDSESCRNELESIYEKAVHLKSEGTEGQHEDRSDYAALRLSSLRSSTFAQQNEISVDYVVMKGAEVAALQQIDSDSCGNELEPRLPSEGTEEAKEHEDVGNNMASTENAPITAGDYIDMSGVNAGK